MEKTAIPKLGGTFAGETGRAVPDRTDFSEDYIKTVLCLIRKAVQNKNAVLPVCGDTASLVSAALLCRALPKEKIHAVFTDHGMFRKGEADCICAELARLGISHIVRINAENEFLNGTVHDGNDRVIGPLSATCDPEKKRQTMDAMFGKIVSKAVFELALCPEETVFVHSPDCPAFFDPESSGLETDTGLTGKRLREFAAFLGIRTEKLPPFPLPFSAFGTRILCNDSALAITSVQREALDALLAELAGDTDCIRGKLDLHPDEDGYKYTARIAPVRTIGMREGTPCYKSLVVLCGGGLHADFGEAAEIAKVIPERLDFINRTAFRLDSDAPSSLLHCYPMHVCRETVELLREADAIVSDALGGQPLTECFPVLLPVTADQNKRFSLILRMTAEDENGVPRTALPGVGFSADAFGNAVQTLKAKLGDRIDMILCDMTETPPAVLELE